MSKTFNLYYIDDEYIDFLRRFDFKVPINKNRTRPFVGIVCVWGEQKYFIPMSSPKEKHMNMNPNLADIYKINNGQLGILNINNMIPATISVIEKIDFEKQEKTYSKLLKEQLMYLNNNKKELLFKIKKFFVLYEKDKLYENIKQRTCDFYLLNEKCKQWERENKIYDNSVNEDCEIYKLARKHNVIPF